MIQLRFLIPFLFLCTDFVPLFPHFLLIVPFPLAFNRSDPSSPCMSHNPNLMRCIVLLVKSYSFCKILKSLKLEDLMRSQPVCLKTLHQASPHSINNMLNLSIHLDKIPYQWKHYDFTDPKISQNGLPWQLRTISLFCILCKFMKRNVVAHLCMIAYLTHTNFLTLNGDFIPADQQ